MCLHYVLSDVNQLFEVVWLLRCHNLLDKFPQNKVQLSDLIAT